MRISLPVQLSAGEAGGERSRRPCLGVPGVQVGVPGGAGRQPAVPGWSFLGEQAAVPGEQPARGAAPPAAVARHSQAVALRRPLLLPRPGPARPSPGSGEEMT